MAFLHNTIYVSLLLSLLALSSCSSDNPVNPNPEVYATAAYLELSVATGGTLGSRANPTGGETGDGYEHGRNKENNIYNLSLFVYIDGGQGLDGNYPIRWTKYIDKKDLIQAGVTTGHPIDQIYNIRIPLEQADFEALRTDQGTLRALVVANAGNITTDKKTLKDVCDNQEYGQAWTTPLNGLPETADNFVMSSAFNGAKSQNNYGYNDGYIKVSNNENSNIVYSTKVTLERVAARIDLQFNNSNVSDSDSGLYYNVSNSDNTLLITNIHPVNVMQQASYLVKHVSKEAFDLRDDNFRTENLLIAGDETSTGMGSDILPTNYVITPHFISKPTDSNNDIFRDWYGDTRAAYFKESTADLTSLNSLAPDLIASRFTPEGEGANTKAIVLGYANENTHHKDVQVVSTVEDNKLNPSDYLTGLLIRAQYRPAKLYTKGDLSETTQYADGKPFWLFRQVSETVEESKNIYFDSEDALKEYLSTLPAPNDNSYETVYYPQGICYYNIWIKHANIDGSDENFPMKYGIVRNNIYRISLNFNGIGSPEPEFREPYNVTSRIYVLKWNFRLQPEIIM